MKLSAGFICRMNPTYNLERFQEALRGEEETLIYSQCCTCGMVYCPHVWSDETLRKIYELTIDHEKSREKIFSIDKRSALVREWEMILRVASIFGRRNLKDFKLIDFGCGWGDFLEVTAGAGVQALGFDDDFLKTEEARKRGLAIARSTEELKSFGPVDVFVLNAVIEHLQDVDAVMNLAKNLLKPGGLLVLGTMDFRPAFVKENCERLKAGRPLLSPHFNPVEHVNVYDDRSVRKTLEKFGFRFLATRWSLTLADLPLPGIRNSRTVLRMLNTLEKFLTAVPRARELSIVAYAMKT